MSWSESVTGGTPCCDRSGWRFVSGDTYTKTAESGFLLLKPESQEREIQSVSLCNVSSYLSALPR